MAIVRGEYKAYDFDRMVVLFTMMDGDAEVPCAISTSAMDDLEQATRTKAEQREAQFMRLREQIEERAARKFLRVEFEGQPPGIILRSIDFRS
jgi:3'-phosphoadenosine 5'-phosphosulfate sulfotransferase